MNPINGIALVSGLALIIGLIWVYNRLVRQRNIVSAAWADIDVQLQKRHELVPNLVATVRGYLRHEADTLKDLTLARRSTPEQLDQLARQETGLSQALGQLFILAEDYPELKASQSLGQLHESLVEIENQLQYARRYFNGAVRDNNTLVESFPVNLMARPLGFKAAEFFEIELVSQREAPRVVL